MVYDNGIKYMMNVVPYLLKWAIPGAEMSADFSVNKLGTNSNN